MAGQGGSIDGGRELAETEQKNPLLGRLIRRIIDGANTGFKNAGVSPTGENAPPPPINSVAVKVGSVGEHMHVQITHNGPVERNIRYFVEVHTDPSFNQPVVEDHGTSRTRLPYNLPTFEDDGSTKANYYVRAYAQNPGGQPTQPYVVGGIGNPTAFQMNGASALTMLPSTGSGTAAPTGQQGGSGLGKVQSRP